MKTNSISSEIIQRSKVKGMNLTFDTFTFRIRTVMRLEGHQFIVVFDSQLLGSLLGPC